MIDEPWFATGSGRAEHVDLLDAYVGDWIAERTRAEVLAAFEEAGAAVAPVYDAADLIEDPHVRETQMLVEVAGRRPRPAAPAQRHVADVRDPRRIRFTGRALGADTDAVLDELGYDRGRDHRP